MKREFGLILLFFAFLFNVGLIDAAWDLSNISYDNTSFDVSNQSSVTTGIFFKEDGTKMYITSQFTDPDRVYQYSLSTPWNVSTASYDNVNLVLNAGQSASGALFFKSDGTALYVIDSFSLLVYQYFLSSPWDVSSGPANSTITFAPQDNSRGLAFKPDGSKMYTTGINGDSVYQYSLSSPWNISTASYDNVYFNVSNQDTVPLAVFFKNDGTKMFMMGFTNRIYQYSLPQAWSISNASYDNINFNISNQETEPNDLFFNASGDKIYLVGSVSDKVHQYSLGFVESPLNITTFENVNVTNNLTVGNNLSASRGFFTFLGSVTSRITKGWFTDLDVINLVVDTSTLFVNSTNNRVGIGTSSPQNTLNVIGDTNITGSTYLSNASCSIGQILTTNSQGLVSCVNKADVKSGTLSNIAYGDHVITFNTAFSSIPSISLTYCAVKTRIADTTYAKNISTTGFIIQYTKAQGGPNENADVCWIATNAGNS